MLAPSMFRTGVDVSIDKRDAHPMGHVVRSHACQRFKRSKGTPHGKGELQISGPKTRTATPRTHFDTL